MSEWNELKVRFDDQDRRCHELFAARATAIDQVEAIGGDARVAEIEERRRTTLLEIEDGALRYLQLRAGIAATEQALTIYRERHRSSMMEQASAAFRTISRGAYSGLAAQPGKDGETLIAIAAGGGSKAADELSKDTRFQLYLALRVAGYHEFTKARAGPCPSWPTTSWRPSTISAPKKPSPVRRHGAQGTGDLPDPPPASLRDRPSGLPDCANAHFGRAKVIASNCVRTTNTTRFLPKGRRQLAAPPEMK